MINNIRFIKDLVELLTLLPYIAKAVDITALSELDLFFRFLTIFNTSFFEGTIKFYQNEHWIVTFN